MYNVVVGLKLGWVIRVTFVQWSGPHYLICLIKYSRFCNGSHALKMVSGSDQSNELSMFDGDHRSTSSKLKGVTVQ